MHRSLSSAVLGQAVQSCPFLPATKQMLSLTSADDQSCGAREFTHDWHDATCSVSELWCQLKCPCMTQIGRRYDHPHLQPMQLLCYANATCLLMGHCVTMPAPIGGYHYNSSVKESICICTFILQAHAPLDSLSTASVMQATFDAGYMSAFE